MDNEIYTIPPKEAEEIVKPIGNQAEQLIQNTEDVGKLFAGDPRMEETKVAEVMSIIEKRVFGGNSNINLQNAELIAKFLDTVKSTIEDGKMAGRLMEDEKLMTELLGVLYEKTRKEGLEEFTKDEEKLLALSDLVKNTVNPIKKAA